VPELPDVEVFKQYVESTALHKKMDAVEIRSKDMLKNVSGREIKKALEGHQFVSADRHGKYLFLKTENTTWLVLHFGMTGFVTYFKDPTKEPAHNRLLIRFSNGYHLAYDCQRKLGEITLTEDPGLFAEERQLGLDALKPGFNLDRFKHILKNTASAVKSALMNQKYIAGIGNIYSDEILFQAGIHPDTKSKELNDDEIARLYNQAESVLKAAIEAHADPSRFPASFIMPHRRGDRTCPKCKGGIEKTKTGGRSAYYCPRCQERI